MFRIEFRIKNSARTYITPGVEVGAPKICLKSYNVQKWEIRFTLELNAAKNMYYIKKVSNKVVQNWISYKKLRKGVCLCLPGVELGGSNDMFKVLCTEMGNLIHFKQIHYTTDTENSYLSTIAVFDYPKNLTLFDTECKKVLGSLLLVVRFNYGVWYATFDLPWGYHWC